MHATYAATIGMASWEALWARFDGDDPHVRKLRAWAPTFRRQAWRDALAAQGVLTADEALLDHLQASFEAARRATHLLFPDALPALELLRSRYRLALLTNGDSGLQREKVAGAHLGDSFDVLRLAEDELAVIIADVSGHGLSTGLRMAMLKAALLILVEETHDPEAILHGMRQSEGAHSARRHNHPVSPP